VGIPHHPPTAATIIVVSAATDVRASGGQVPDVIADPGDLWWTSRTHGALIMCASRNELANILCDRKPTPPPPPPSDLSRDIFIKRLIAPPAILEDEGVATSYSPRVRMLRDATPSSRSALRSIRIRG